MIALIPNEHHHYSLRDAVHGLCAAMGPKHQRSVEPIELPDVGPCIPVRSGRAAIVVALWALGLPPGACIGVPLYCCPVVFKAIHAAGCRIRFLDVDPDTYCVSVQDVKAKRADLDALIAVHMFGNVCDMPRLRDALPDKPLIEDCAQSLGSRLNGRPCGAFGDITFFSFRLGKYLSVGEGAALFARRPELQARIVDIVRQLPAASRTEECAHVAETYVRSSLRSRPLWGLIGVRLWRAYNRRVKYTSQSPLVLGQIYAADRATTIRRLAFLNAWLERQRSHAAFYQRNLSLDAGMLCAEKPDAFYNRLQYPILTPTRDQCDELVERLYCRQISSARPYKDIAAIAAAHYGYTGDCRWAERIAQTVLVIPCHHALRQRDIEHITACVNRAWAEIRSHSIGAPHVPKGTDTPAMSGRFTCAGGSERPEDDGQDAL